MCLSGEGWHSRAWELLKEGPGSNLGLREVLKVWPANYRWTYHGLVGPWSHPTKTGFLTMTLESIAEGGRDNEWIVMDLKKLTLD